MATTLANGLHYINGITMMTSDTAKHPDMRFFYRTFDHTYMYNYRNDHTDYKHDDDQDNDNTNTYNPDDDLNDDNVDNNEEVDNAIDIHDTETQIADTNNNATDVIVDNTIEINDNDDNKTYHEDNEVDQNQESDDDEAVYTHPETYVIWDSQCNSDIDTDTYNHNEDQQNDQIDESIQENDHDHSETHTSTDDVNDVEYVAPEIKDHSDTEDNSDDHVNASSDNNGDANPENNTDDLNNNQTDDDKTQHDTDIETHTTPNTNSYRENPTDHVCWDVQSTARAQGTINPIRRIVETMDIKPNPEKEMIPLSIGDPTKFGNLIPSPILEEAVVTSIREKKHNGYGPSIGHVDAREAVAKYVSTPESPATASDVLLASGCSDAIEMVITGLVNPGEVLLIPRPGFSLYRTIADPQGIVTKYYNLLPDRDWEVDLEHLDALIDSKTRLIIVNNPSNPCGSVYTADHIRAITDLARRRKVPILADEVYAHFVFKEQKYHSIASLADDVPVFACGGLAKRFVCPGWRMGWIVVHDPCNNLNSQVRQGLQNLSQRIVGPNTIVQGAMPHIFDKIPSSYFDDITDFVAGNAQIFCERLSHVPGLNPIMPSGAMYVMVGINLDMFFDLNTDMDFVQRLVSEQSVFCLPGSCFQFPEYFRAVLTLPRDKLEEACTRIEEFCMQHLR